MEQAQEVFSVIGGVGMEPLKCARAYARYLCHLDNPEKAQYETADVISCSGADYQTMINLATDKYSAIGEMIDFCLQNGVAANDRKYFLCLFHGLYPVKQYHHMVMLLFRCPVCIYILVM